MSLASDDPEAHEAGRWAMRGVRRALAGPMWFMALGYLGTGSIAYDSGAPLGVAVLSTPLIWAGPAQVLYFGALAANTALAAVAVAVSLSSARLLLLSVSLLPMLRREGMKTPMLLYLAHNIAITSWAESMLRLPTIPKAARLPYFLGFVHMLMAGSTVAIAIGWLLAGSVPPVVAAGLLMVAPLYFFTTVVASARQAIDWMAIGFGLLCAPLARLYAPGGFDLLAVGLAGGSIAYGIGRILRARQPKDAR